MSELPAPIVKAPEIPPPQTLVCANCRTELQGEYCVACGQRHEPHIHSVAHFAGEAFESISHADSRLWRTIWYLFSRPGFLTREFFAGRRVSYLPPFRLYLVLSVLFFLLTSLPGGDPGPESGTATPAPAASGQSDSSGSDPATRATQQALGEAREVIRESGIPIRPPDADEQATGLRKTVKIDGLDDFCRAFDKAETGEDGAARRDSVRRFCHKVRYDTASLGTDLLHNVPRAMFVFLPLLAAFMKLLYWKPKRYYVEHLLFLVHNHAAVFLIFIGITLIGFVPWLGGYSAWFVIALLGYLVWYMFRAMRNMYGQGGALTFSKYFVLACAYVATAFITFLFTVIVLAVWGS